MHAWPRSADLVLDVLSWATQMKKREKENRCALQVALNTLGGSYKLLVLRELYLRPCRFGHLRKALPWVSATSLTRVLKVLEREGFIGRTVVTTRPIMVTYSLLHNDPLVREIIEQLTRWGQQYLQRPLPPKS